MATERRIIGRIKDVLIGHSQHIAEDAFCAYRDNKDSISGHMADYELAWRIEQSITGDYIEGSLGKKLAGAALIGGEAFRRTRARKITMNRLLAAQNITWIAKTRICEDGIRSAYKLKNFHIEFASLGSWGINYNGNDVCQIFDLLVDYTGEMAADDESLDKFNAALKELRVSFHGRNRGNTFGDLIVLIAEAMSKIYKEAAKNGGDKKSDFSTELYFSKPNKGKQITADSIIDQFTRKLA